MVEPVSDNILNLVNELYNNLDAKDKIINEQALEMAQLKERFERLKQEHIDTITRNEEKQQRIDKAIEYIKNHSNCSGYFEDGKMIIDNIESIYGGYELLEILGEKE